MTLGIPRSGESNGSPWCLGSAGKTSMAAPAMWPDFRLSASAS